MTDVPPWLLKRPAAVRAVDEYLKDGMVVGLGTGNAANMAVDRIAEYVRKGYSLTLVSSSEATERYARDLGLTVSDICSVKGIDVTFDGADEVAPDLTVIKGLGGALLKEKILASMSVKEVLIIDDFKRVDRLGVKTPLPVEVCRFAHERTADALAGLGCTPVLRVRDGVPFVTDEGHYIYDCAFGGIDSPSELSDRIRAVPGVVECGLFVGLVDSVMSYRDDGSVEEYTSEHRTQTNTYHDDD